MPNARIPLLRLQLVIIGLFALAGGCALFAPQGDTALTRLDQMRYTLNKARSTYQAAYQDGRITGRTYLKCSAADDIARSALDDARVAAVRGDDPNLIESLEKAALEKIEELRALSSPFGPGPGPPVVLPPPTTIRAVVGIDDLFLGLIALLNLLAAKRKSGQTELSDAETAEIFADERTGLVLKELLDAKARAETAE